MGNPTKRTRATGARMLTVLEAIEGLLHIQHVFADQFALERIHHFLRALLQYAKKFSKHQSQGRMG